MTVVREITISKQIIAHASAKLPINLPSDLSSLNSQPITTQNTEADIVDFKHTPQASRSLTIQVKLGRSMLKTGRSSEQIGRSWIET